MYPKKYIYKFKKKKKKKKKKLDENLSFGNRKINL